MKTKVNITEDLIKVIKCLRPQDFGTKLGIDKHDIFCGDGLILGIGRILDLMDHVDVNTLEDWNGPVFDKEASERIYNVSDVLYDNILDIEEIIHQHCDVGLKVGTYVCLDNERMWSFEG